MQFNDLKPEQLPEVHPLPHHAAQFKVAAIGTDQCRLTSYNRRDFYKISLVTSGSSRLLYANRDMEINRPALVFTNSLVPYAWESDCLGHSGYFCVFTESFLQDGNRSMERLRDSAMFKTGGDPVYFPDEAAIRYISSIFDRMLEEAEGAYVYKQELLHNLVQLLLHEAIKLQPATVSFVPHNAASRIAQLFLDLLQQQFPVEGPQHTLQLKKAGDYADRLSVHVNHLNAAVQELTGKSTTTHIQERIVAEARSLLLHTDWSIAAIASSLGFDYASYFNRFFKKHTGLTPKEVRYAVAKAG